jgi:hypothetical protein
LRCGAARFLQRGTTRTLEGTPMAKCPQCETEITSWLHEERVPCPSCHATLITNAKSTNVASLVVWLILDLVAVVVAGALTDFEAALFIPLYVVLTAAAVFFVYKAIYLTTLQVRLAGANRAF